MKKSQTNNLVQDIAIIMLSILIAIILLRTDALVQILTTSQELERLGSFIAGLFFTSIFTTAPAIVTLGEIAEVNPVLSTAFFGALGALTGDLIIFRFVKDRISGHVTELLTHIGVGKRVRALFKLKFFRWLTFLIGGLIIASPLPDELGITLLGLSKMRMLSFILLSFVFNFYGILIIGIIARSISQ